MHPSASLFFNWSEPLPRFEILKVVSLDPSSSIDPPNMKFGYDQPLFADRLSIGAINVTSMYFLAGVTATLIEHEVVASVITIV